VILTAQTLQRLNDEHSLLLAPYMLNNAELITELGYNVRVLEEGFNDRNIYPREAAFNGETLKHILLSVRPQSLEKWFNKKWRPIWDKNSPGKTLQYILDGTKILIPPHLASRFEGSGYVKDDEGEICPLEFHWVLHRAQSYFWPQDASIYSQRADSTQEFEALPTLN